MPLQRGPCLVPREISIVHYRELSTPRAAIAPDWDAEEYWDLLWNIRDTPVRRDGVVLYTLLWKPLV